MILRRCSLQQLSYYLLLSCLLLLAVSSYLLRSTEAKNESFPVRRPLTNLWEAALQTVGRDGPRYPEDGFLITVHKHRAAHNFNNNSNKTTNESTSGFPNLHSSSDQHCSNGYAILTIANPFVMDNVVPLLLESLRRIELPGSASTGPDASSSSESGNHPHNLASHTLVVSVSKESYQGCARLRRRYKNGCLTDPYSGLADGDNVYPNWRFLAYGLAKLKYIVNVLTSGTDVLYVDADVVFLRNPFPSLLLLPPEAGGAHIAVATASAPCGTAPTRPEWATDFQHDISDADVDSTATEERAAAAASSQQGQSQQRALLQKLGPDGATTSALTRGYAPGITFYRSNPGVMRCVYSLLLDMFSGVMHWAKGSHNVTVNGTTVNGVTQSLNDTAQGPVVLEQDHFASFMPVCTEALGLTLSKLPAHEYITTCGTHADVETLLAERDSGSGGAVVAVHAAGASSGSYLRDRLPLLQRLLGLQVGDLMSAAANTSQPVE